MASTDDDGFITPPPGLIPPKSTPDSRAPETDSATHRITVDAARPDTPPPFFATPIGAPPPAPHAARPPAHPESRALVVAGVRRVLERTILLGRNPATSASWPEADLLSLDDPAKTVSKTHAVIQRVGDRFVLVDLNSTNGVRVVRAGVDALVLEPNTPAELLRGDHILLGDFRVDFD